MSKQEHDAAVAELRKGISTLAKPWYRSSSDLLRRRGIQGKKCLDLCCGNGEFSHILRDQHGMDVTCADYIPFHLQHAQDQGFSTVSVDIDASEKELDAAASPHAGQFDLVVNLAAIEHVFNSDNLLRFAHTVLTPGGFLLVNTPNIGFLAYRIYDIFSGNRPFGEGHHIRFWDYRFLRTNLFLNGFTVTEDARGFYSLPQDAMLRALRNKRRLAAGIAWLFHGCRLFQYLPFFKGLCSDELTVLAVKDNTPAIGFELNRVQRFLNEQQGSTEGRAAKDRLQEARRRGWLDEHLYLAKTVDELI
ncbi:MAG: methyltransferase domain-containing protein [Candidatus Electrothrix aestuarii]|uniref:Methyltransferase domain-containing protein n=1 Tax=Candidatus Electrothrix aestuarii TaxID=3062594 RepID=A0AAU8LX53_9BACT|nr:methyltransferase domain-containing protein [Candidatus Electrothrix aestuarii]